MENYSNGNLGDPGLQIIRHPAYQLFDIRVFYVRISNLLVDDSMPECLTLNHVPLSPDSILEVNGVRCSMDLEGMSCILRRDRVDKKSEEVTFITTDSVRLTGGLKFEVLDKEELVITGVLEKSGDSNDMAKKWVMKIRTGVGFKQITGRESILPTIEVYVAGCLSGTPIVLTKTLQINHQKKHRKATLRPIPEHCNLQVAEYKKYKAESGEDCWRQTQYIEGEDGELSWFNAGVRVGVGIGLGVCLGIGIGVGLFVRTYHNTARTFKRRLL